ncbi:nesprin-2 [Mustelus asterias]
MAEFNPACVVEMHAEECLSLGLVDSPLSDCWITETERSNHHHVSAARHSNKSNVSAASIESRIKMEQSWQLWREFLEDYSRFKDWIQQAEAIAKEPRSSLALYTEMKAELQRFECLRKRTEEQAIRLESINRRYRRLAKEQGLGLGTQLKGMMHDGNQRWDNLQRRVGIICKRLKYFVSQREEFEAARENLWLQLMELDLQRNKLEYLSPGEVTEKLNQQQVFQETISCISEKMDELLMAALNLLQKSEPQDAVTIEEEVWELLQFQLEVFGQVAGLYKSSTEQVFEWELANRGAGGSDHHSDTILEGQGVEHRGGPITQHPLGDHQPGHWSPFGANSLPLEWDSSVDIGGSRTYEGSVSDPCLVPDQSVDLYGKGSAWGSCRVRPTRRRVKTDSRKVKQVDVACQCDSEVNLTPGPLFIEKQVFGDRLLQV